MAETILSMVLRFMMLPLRVVVTCCEGRKRRSRAEGPKVPTRHIVRPAQAGWPGPAVTVQLGELSSAEPGQCRDSPERRVGSRPVSGPYSARGRGPPIVALLPCRVGRSALQQGLGT